MPLHCGVKLSALNCCFKLKRLHASYLGFRNLFITPLTIFVKRTSSCKATSVRYFRSSSIHPRKLIMNPEFEAYWNTQLLSSKQPKLIFQPAERNKHHILETLKLHIEPAAQGKLLEISSGSGQHVAHISPEFPHIIFQPSDIEQHFLSSIGEFIRSENLTNVRHPVYLNVEDPVESWGNDVLLGQSFDFVLVVNLLHVAPWSCSEGLFKGCNVFLKTGGLLFTYGAFSSDGVISPESNVQFDRGLRAQNPNWGLRDIYKELQPLASKFGIELIQIHDLPANNKMLVWQRKGVLCGD